MPLLTTLIFGIGPSVAKALLKSVLKEYPLIGDIAPDLLDLLRDSAKGERTRREENGRIDAIGESVAARLRPLFDDARLTDAERAAVLRWEHIQLDSGRAVLLIDGVDELPSGKREAFLGRLQSLVRLYPQARYIITSRPAAVSQTNWPE